MKARRESMENDRLTITLLVLMCFLLITYSGFTVASFNQEVTKRKAAQENLNWLKGEFSKLNSINRELLKKITDMGNTKISQLDPNTFMATVAGR
jgi:hypothetical protein